MESDGSAAVAGLTVGKAFAPSDGEIRLFKGAYLYNPCKLNVCPERSEIQWTTEAYSVKSITKATSLPAIVRAITGWSGSENTESVSSDQVSVTYGIYHQKRVMAVAYRSFESYHVSFPVDGYSRLFTVGKSASNQSAFTTTHDADVPATLDAIIKRHDLPVMVRFHDEKLHSSYGHMELVDIYHKKYLYGHNMTGDGRLFKDVTYIPFDLEITLSIAKGLISGNGNDWIIFKESYIRQSAILMEGVQLSYNNEMIELDDHRKTSDLDADYSLSSLPQFTNNTRTLSKKIQDREEEEEDSCYVVFLPNAYDDVEGGGITLTANAEDKLYIKVEGRQGVIGRRMARMLEFFGSKAAEVFPAPRPLPPPPRVDWPRTGVFLSQSNSIAPTHSRRATARSTAPGSLRMTGETAVVDRSNRVGLAVPSAAAEMLNHGTADDSEENLYELVQDPEENFRYLQSLRPSDGSIRGGRGLVKAGTSAAARLQAAVAPLRMADNRSKLPQEGADTVHSGDQLLTGRGHQSSIKSIGDIPRDFSELSNEDVCRCFRLCGLESIAAAFEDDGVIDGSLLRDLDAQAFSEHFRFTRYESAQVMKFVRDGWRPKK